MREYPKIQSVYKRDERTHKFIEGKFSTPEFEFLNDNKWLWTEKVDGTNVRVYWPGITFPNETIPTTVMFGGRTERAQMPTFLYDKLVELFPTEKFMELYPSTCLTLYGEGFGARIQKGGGNYIPDGVDFVLFDVLIEGWWLRRPDIVDIAGKLDIGVVPIVGFGTLQEAVSYTKAAPLSKWGEFIAEGLVLKPDVELKDRAGHRIVTKMKYKDW